MHILQRERERERERKKEREKLCCVGQINQSSTRVIPFVDTRKGKFNPRSRCSKMAFNPSFWARRKWESSFRHNPNSFLVSFLILVIVSEESVVVSEKRVEEEERGERRKIDLGKKFFSYFYPLFPFSALCKCNFSCCWTGFQVSLLSSFLFTPLCNLICNTNCLNFRLGFHSSFIIRVTRCQKSLSSTCSPFWMGVQFSHNRREMLHKDHGNSLLVQYSSSFHPIRSYNPCLSSSPTANSKDRQSNWRCGCNQWDFSPTFSRQSFFLSDNRSAAITWPAKGPDGGTEVVNDGPKIEFDRAYFTCSRLIILHAVFQFDTQLNFQPLNFYSTLRQQSNLPMVDRRGTEVALKNHKERKRERERERERERKREREKTKERKSSNRKREREREKRLSFSLWFSFWWHK